MTGSRILRFGFFFALAAGIGSAQTPPAPADALSLTPAIVESGSPELIRVGAPADSRRGDLDGEWLGKKLEFFRGRDGQAWYALTGVDVESPEGSSTLRISLRTTAATGAIDLSRTVEIRPAHYRTTTLTVAPKFVAPGPEELARIKAEIELKAKVFAASAPEPLWRGNFRAPVTAAPTDSFGTRRVFNGKLASVHKGMDFRAAVGTPVRAGNSSFTLYFDVRSQATGEQLLDAETIYVNFDPATQRSRPLPAAVRDRLKADLPEPPAQGPSASTAVLPPPSA